LTIDDWLFRASGSLELTLDSLSFLSIAFRGLTGRCEYGYQLVGLRDQFLSGSRIGVVRVDQQFEPSLRFVSFLDRDTELGDELIFATPATRRPIVAVDAAGRVNQLWKDLSRRQALGNSFAKENDVHCKTMRPPLEFLGFWMHAARPA
jgi:hypothetical protein